MKKRIIAKTGATMLTMAMLLNGTTVLAAVTLLGAAGMVKIRMSKKREDDEE